MKDIIAKIEKNFKGKMHRYSISYTLAGRPTYVEWEAEIDLTEEELINIIKQSYD